MFDLSVWKKVPQSSVQSNYLASSLLFHPFIPVLLQVYMLIH